MWWWVLEPHLQILKHLLQQDLHVRVFIQVSAKQIFDHSVVDAVQRWQAKEQARIVHDVIGARVHHVLL